MNQIKEFSEERFKLWYMKREYCKSGRTTLPGREQLLDEFEHYHASGKGLSQFYPRNWSIVVLSQPEFENLIHLESGWTNQAGLTVNGQSRRLIEIATRAKACGYWENPDKRHLDYYEKFKTNSLVLSGLNRIVIRNVTIGEGKNDSSALFYLHDGNGRGLAYIRALKKLKVEYHPVEAIYADTTRK